MILLRLRNVFAHAMNFVSLVVCPLLVTMGFRSSPQLVLVRRDISRAHSGGSKSGGESGAALKDCRKALIVVVLRPQRGDGESTKEGSQPASWEPGQDPFCTALEGIS